VRLLVLVPAYNESLSVTEVVRELQLGKFDVLVIDDGSDDDTAIKAAKAGAMVIRLPFNIGVGGALRAGFKFARTHGYDAVVQVDADGQHPVQEITSLVAAAEETGADMILGSRFATGRATMAVSAPRRFAMWVLSRSASKATNCEITDATSGFRLIREPLLGAFADKFAANYLGDTFEALVAAGRAGYSVHEIPANLRPRQSGVSSASTSQALTFLLKAVAVAALRLHPPIRPRNG
jgi:glycosyltransferase involved in cell wall biosynthesis